METEQRSILEQVSPDTNGPNSSVSAIDSLANSEDRASPKKISEVSCDELDFEDDFCEKKISKQESPDEHGIANEQNERDSDSAGGENERVLDKELKPEKENGGKSKAESNGGGQSDGELSQEDNELEEGEVKDAFPEQPPQKICPFFIRGICSWGFNCRFLHQRPSDKGNYNMFSPKRVCSSQLGLGPHRGIGFRPNLGKRIGPPRYDVDLSPPEIAPFPFPDAPREPSPDLDWERELKRTKELMKANKSKKQGPNFEEEQMNLSGDESDSSSVKSDKENEFSTEGRNWMQSNVYNRYCQQKVKDDSYHDSRKRDRCEEFKMRWGKQCVNNNKYEEKLFTRKLFTERFKPNGHLSPKDRRKDERLSGIKTTGSGSSEWNDPRWRSNAVKPTRKRLRSKSHSSRSYSESGSSRESTQRKVPSRPLPYKRRQRSSRSRSISCSSSSRSASKSPPRRHRSASKPPQRHRAAAKSPPRHRAESKSPPRHRAASKLPPRYRASYKSPRRYRSASKSPQRPRPASKLPPRYRASSKSPRRYRSASKSPQRPRPASKLPSRYRAASKSPRRYRAASKSPRRYPAASKSPRRYLAASKSPRRYRAAYKSQLGSLFSRKSPRSHSRPRSLSVSSVGSDNGNDANYKDNPGSREKRQERSCEDLATRKNDARRKILNDKLKPRNSQKLGGDNRQPEIRTTKSLANESSDTRRRSRTPEFLKRSPTFGFSDSQSSVSSYSDRESPERYKKVVSPNVDRDNRQPEIRTTKALANESSDTGRRFRFSDSQSSVSSYSDRESPERYKKNLSPNVDRVSPKPQNKTSLRFSYSERKALPFATVLNDCRRRSRPSASRSRSRNSATNRTSPSRSRSFSSESESGRSHSSSGSEHLQAPKKRVSLAKSLQTRSPVHKNGVEMSSIQKPVVKSSAPSLCSEFERLMQYDKLRDKTKCTAVAINSGNTLRVSATERKATDQSVPADPSNLPVTEKSKDSFKKRKQIGLSSANQASNSSRNSTENSEMKSSDKGSTLQGASKGTKRPLSPISERTDCAAKRPTISRKEILLKQLRAVENELARRKAEEH